MGRAYDPDLLWQTKSGTWSIGLAYEASAIPVMPSSIVARVVIHGARYPVDAIIDATGRVSFGDDVRDIPQYVRDQAAWLLRNKYNRLKGYSDGTDTRRQRPQRPKAPKQKPKEPEKPKTVTKTVTKIVVQPPRDSKGRFKPWTAGGKTKASGKPKAPAKKTKGGAR